MSNDKENSPLAGVPASTTSPSRQRGSNSSGSRLRAASIKLMESSPPLGFMQATGEAAAKAPSLAEIRRGSFGNSGWDAEGQRRNSIASGKSGRQSLSRENPAQSPALSSRSQKASGSSTFPRDTVDDTLFEDKITSVDDGFPEMVFGRGEMVDQSYVRGPKKERQESELADLDDDYELRPKRGSKNLKAIFGESPRPSASIHPSQENAQPIVPDANGVYPNGYKFPPKYTWVQSIIIGLKGFWKFTITPLGFLIIVYGLNVVAWGGMLFLLLCNASPAMCWVNGKFDCNDIDCPRRVWLEIDSQILNALFCVTGFGLIPWRFRDFYYLLQWRLRKSETAFRKLAGIHRSWFRLPESDLLPVKPSHYSDVETGSTPDSTSPLATYSGVEDLNNPALPLPLKKAPDQPLTGVRASPTKPWKLDYVIWLFVWNTFLQTVLSGFMWGYNRYDRPSWSTGLFVAMAFIVAMMAGLMQFNEGKRIKKVEGVPVAVAKKLKDVEAREKAEVRNTGVRGSVVGKENGETRGEKWRKILASLG